MKTSLATLGCMLLLFTRCASDNAEALLKKAHMEPDPEEKLELYTRAIELEPDNPLGYFERGSFHEVEVWSIKDIVQKGMRPEDGLAEEHYRKALVDFDKAIELKPSYAQAYYQRGLVHFEIGGHLEEACSDWHTAQEMGYDAQDMINKNCP